MLFLCCALIDDLRGIKLNSSLLASLTLGQIIQRYDLGLEYNVLNINVVPLMPLVGMITANLNTMVRGESKASISIGMKTFVLASIAFATVWFALLVTAIYTGGDTNTLAGIEVLILFIIGLSGYSLLKLERFIGVMVQVWLYRLALPIVIISCLLVMLFG